MAKDEEVDPAWMDEHHQNMDEWFAPASEYKVVGHQPAYNINPQHDPAVNVTPHATVADIQAPKESGVRGKFYSLGADVDLLNKYGLGLTKSGVVVKLPTRTYTWEDGSETVPARTIHQSAISDLRARYNTDNGVEYGISRQPIEKGWSVHRADPTTHSSWEAHVSPYYKGINYTKNFADGGEVIL